MMVSLAEVSPLVEALASVATIVGVPLLYWQLREMTKQNAMVSRQLELARASLDETNKWNQVSAQHTLLSVLPSMELEQAVWETLDALEGGSRQQLSPDDCAKIYAEIPSWVRTKSFLNGFERLCAAVNAGILDDHYAYCVHGTRVVDTFRVFEPYIGFVRARANDHTIYIELERVATAWGVRSAREADRVREDADRLRYLRGVKSVLPSD